EDFKASGADLITIHTEACEDIKATLEKIHEAGLKAGLSIKPKTPVETVIPYLSMVDMILLMSVEPGFGGQSFIDGSLERAAELKKLIDEHCAETGRHIDLEIDGGVNKDNVQDILNAGVNVIVAGSAVFKAPYENTKYFMKILEG
ncbi:MAG: ribulose-phosphate 3-epimerase, partial [Parasporobacterium sp.]|nr:ribulose-phosphate 3-epimerase [Parasporobacterium sp.]